jgi:hypothetical protein
VHITHTSLLRHIRPRQHRQRLSYSPKTLLHPHKQLLFGTDFGKVWSTHTAQILLPGSRTPSSPCIVGAAHIMCLQISQLRPFSSVIFSLHPHRQRLSKSTGSPGSSGFKIIIWKASITCEYEGRYSGIIDGNLYRSICPINKYELITYNPGTM